MFIHGNDRVGVRVSGIGVETVRCVSVEANWKLRLPEKKLLLFILYRKKNDRVKGKQRERERQRESERESDCVSI